jgi:hypothetical protein
MLLSPDEDVAANAPVKEHQFAIDRKCSLDLSVLDECLEVA